MPQPPSVFGEIDGYSPGSHFISREAVRVAGLHRHGMAGISGHYGDGADAIVISGGYPDDDHGDRVLYTGEGGQDATTKKQVKDQTLTKGNLALARAEERGVPVRVIRGHGGDKRYSPSSGFRYDGLYVVTGHSLEPSPDGPLIWRFQLEASDGGTDWEPVPPGGGPPAGTMRPGRKASVLQRVVRNSAVTQWVKDKHGGECQFCGITLETAAGVYSEGAHVRPLGRPHYGADVVSNVLCLCPNDHVLLDKGALYVEQGWVHVTATRTRHRPVRVVAGHGVDPVHYAYHRERIAGVK